MTESSDASDTPAKPQDYAGLRTELATLVNDSEVGPRLGAVNCRNLQLSRPFGPTELQGEARFRPGRRDSSDAKRRV